MDQHSAFLQAIREDPDDNTPRLIYADYLADQGQDDRAELIRVQCELSAGVSNRDRSQELRRRLRELSVAHRAEWVGDLAKLVPSAAFERGFIEEVHLSAKAFLEHARAMLERHPIVRLNLDESTSVMKQLADSVHLSGMRMLNLRANKVDDSDLAVLLRSPHLQQLQVLALEHNRLSSTSVPRLLDPAQLPNLEVLRLASNRLSDRSAEVMLELPGLPTLRVLDLSENSLTDRAAQALARTAWLGKLQLLRLLGTELTLTGALALLESPHLAGVRTIHVPANAIRQERTALVRRFGARLQAW